VLENYSNKGGSKMNAERRKAIKEVQNKIRLVLAEAHLLKEDVTALLEEEQEYFDNIPENLQNSARYENSEEVISCIEDAIVSLEEAENSLEETLEGLNQVV
jgi:F0F1-type ATP synthase membrane subunit b/b'